MPSSSSTYHRGSSRRSRSPSPRDRRYRDRGSERAGAGSPPPSPVRRLHLADLDESVSRRSVEDAFSKYGRLADVWVASYPPFFGFVVFERSEDAADALKAMRRGYIGKCSIRTTIALPRGSRRSPRPSFRRDDRGGNGGGSGGYYRSGGSGGGGGRDYRRRSRSRSPPPRRRYHSRSRSPVNNVSSSNGHGRHGRSSPVADEVSD